MAEDAARLLLVRDLVTGYGKRKVLNAVDIDVAPAEIVSVIGHNGAGKSTLLKAVFGLLPIWSGRVMLGGITLTTPNPRTLLKLGVSYVPQGSRVFPDLTVLENLELGAITLRNRPKLEEGIEQVFKLFPTLKSRLRQRAGDLSGGEKQMLALGSALVLSPRLLLLDEPSLGLAPSLVADAFCRIQQISYESEAAVVIVEQKVRDVLKIAHRVFVLRNGRVSFSGPTRLLEDETKLLEVYL